MSEEERVREIFNRMRRGEAIGNQLVYDKGSRSLRPSSCCKDPDNAIAITNQDKHLWGCLGR